MQLLCQIAYANADRRVLDSVAVRKEFVRVAWVQIGGEYVYRTSVLQ